MVNTSTSRVLKPLCGSLFTRFIGPWHAGLAHLFFHPPRFPGAPPVDRGAGPNSGPDSRELVGWMILLAPPNGLLGSARSGREGRASGPWISSGWGLWTFEPERPRLVAPPP